MPMSTRSFRLIAYLCLVSLGCTEEADIPDVPDLEALREQFDAPTAELDGSNVRAIRLPSTSDPINRSPAPNC